VAVHAEFATTEGSFTVRLFDQEAPETVANFVGLAEGTKEWTHPGTQKKMTDTPFYDGIVFHRVIDGFMIQGGDPLTKDPSMEARWGTGHADERINEEFNERNHVFGVISMARSQDPNSAGSQFFICHDKATFLDGQYTAFGKLIKGDEVLEKINSTQTGPQDRPVKKIVMTSVKIVPREEAMK